MQGSPSHQTALTIGEAASLTTLPNLATLTEHMPTIGRSPALVAEMAVGTPRPLYTSATPLEQLRRVGRNLRDVRIGRRER